MASSDWTLITDGATGFSAIVDETGSPYFAQTATALQTSEGITYQNITGGALLNTSISAWIRAQISGSNSVPQLTLRSQDVLWLTGTKYLLQLNPQAGNIINLQVHRYNAGVITYLYSGAFDTAPNPNGSLSWQRWKFSAINSGSNVLLRIENWNGASWDVVTDIIDSSASKIAVAGFARFGNDDTGVPATNINKFDEIEISSLV